jgi:hypothetical protein
VQQLSSLNSVPEVVVMLGVRIATRSYCSVVACYRKDQLLPSLIAMEGSDIAQLRPKHLSSAHIMSAYVDFLVFEHLKCPLPLLIGGTANARGRYSSFEPSR